MISGGSGTLGSETAGRLAKDNKVIILGRTEETLKETAQELGCEYLVCDVTDEEQVAKTVDVIIDRHKKIDVLINNAGAYISGPLEDNEPEEIRRIMEIDALGPAYPGGHSLYERGWRRAHR